MRTIHATVVLGLVQLLLTLSVQASDCGEDALGVAGHLFDMSDTNADGVLSPEEFDAAGLERYGVTFSEFDADGNGETSVDEYFDLFEFHHPPTDMI
jgi:hypothetical protein